MGISPCNERQRVVFETSANFVLAVACFAGLGLFVCSDLGLTPQALCCRLLSQAY
jgi:hypothetical protein